MKKALRITGLVIALALIGIQFVRHAPNQGLPEGPQSIVAHHPVPAPVRLVLQRACYDCHSNRTNYPWYAAVQPVAWWLNDHIVHGKSELNFSEFASYEPRRAVRKLQAVADEVHERHMPLPSYRLVHPEAKLSDADVALLTTWAEDLAGEIESR